MGKKKSRKGVQKLNPIFKVANGKAQKSRGRPKEVTSKLKSVMVRQPKGGNVVKEAVESLDVAMADLRKSDLLTVKSACKKKIRPISMPSQTALLQDVGHLADLLAASSTSSAQST